MRLQIEGNADNVVARLGDIPEKVAVNLKTTVEALEQELLGTSRAATPVRTGALQASIEGKTIAARYGAIAEVGANPTGGNSEGSRRAYYALFVEFGAKIPPHKILPNVKQALAFNGIFVKRVQSPGGTIEAQKFIHGPFEGMRKQILAGLNEAVSEGLK